MFHKMRMISAVQRIPVHRILIERDDVKTQMCKQGCEKKREQDETRCEKKRQLDDETRCETKRTRCERREQDVTQNVKRKDN
jgi:hypothetical protein